MFTEPRPRRHRPAASSNVRCAAGLDKWLKKSDYEFVERLSSVKYPCGDLTIIVTIEFLLKIGGDMALVKPFLRQDEFTRDAKNAFSFLVAETHGKLYKAQPLLLVAREAKLQKGRPTRSAATIVRAEADKFVSMWRSNQVA